MKFLILFSLFTLIMSAPANVLVVTKVRYQTVVVGGGSTKTLEVTSPTTSSSSEPVTSTITKTLTRTKTEDGETKVEETEVEQTVTTAGTAGTTDGTDASSGTSVVHEKAVVAETTSSVATTSTPATSAPTTPTTSTTPTTPTTSTTSTSSSPSETGSGDHSGEGTYYDTGLGACGITNKDTDYIVAISHELFDETDTGNPNNNPVCGRKIQAHYQGKSVQVTVTDRCEGCAYNDLDFSPSAFTDLADKGLGRIDITWDWVN